jgi:hypothetical protein
VLAVGAQHPGAHLLSPQAFAAQSLLPHSDDDAGTWNRTQARRPATWDALLIACGSQARPSPPVAAAKETTPQGASGSHTLSTLPHLTAGPHHLLLPVRAEEPTGGNCALRSRPALRCAAARATPSSVVRHRSCPSYGDAPWGLICVVRLRRLALGVPRTPQHRRIPLDAELDDARCAVRQPPEWTFGASCAPSPP